MSAASAPIHLARVRVTRYACAVSEKAKPGRAALDALMRKAEEGALPIIRTDAGGFLGFGEYDGPQGDSFAGRFAELMPPQPATMDQRALARRLLDAMGLSEAVLSGTPFNN